MAYRNVEINDQWRQNCFFYRVRRKSVESLPDRTELHVSQLFMTDFRFLK